MTRRLNEEEVLGMLLGFVFVVGSTALIGIGIAIGWLMFGGGA